MGRGTRSLIERVRRIGIARQSEFLYDLAGGGSRALDWQARAFLGARIPVGRSVFEKLHQAYLLLARTRTVSVRLPRQMHCGKFWFSLEGPLCRVQQLGLPVSVADTPCVVGAS